LGDKNFNSHSRQDLTNMNSKPEMYGAMQASYIHALRDQLLQRGKTLQQLQAE
jgi:hypothetical protein